MNLNNKIKQYQGHHVLVELVDGRIISGFLKGEANIESAPPYAIFIASDDESDSTSILIEDISEIKLID